ncbi:MAG: SDR family oxidoreductase [Xanthomonadales bacterium]|nr:SDR family oxidoreductase [Xanthomonadales bacterium]
MRVLIAGCGDVGTRLGLLLASEGHEPCGLRRDPSGLPAAITPLAADLSRPGTLRGLPDRLDAVVFLPTPDERTESAYRATYVDGLQRLADALGDLPPRLVVVSSTAVYGQQSGEWVDEDSPAAPGRFNGRVLLEMEARARALSGGAVIVRCSGIYGPGRTWLLAQVRKGEAVQRDPPAWSNRIHADDAAGFLSHLLAVDDPAALYLASDDQPAPRYEVMAWLAERLGVPAPRGQTVPGAAQGRRVRNARLQRSGYRLRYPDFRAGYDALLAGPARDEENTR